MWTDEHRARHARRACRYPSDLTDAQWGSIQNLFSSYVTCTADLREMVNADMYLAKTGCPWDYLPTDFGPRGTVREWHDRFRRDGVWDRAMEILHPAARRALGRPTAPETLIIDSQSVSAGPQAGPRGADGGKKRKGIKRHVAACSAGLLMGVLVTAANVHDSKALIPLVDAVREKHPSIVRVVADSAYAGTELADAMRERGIVLQIAAKPAGTSGFVPIPVRWRVEAVNGILANGYRRLAKHWEGGFRAAEDFTKLASVRRMLNIIHRTAQV
jgi:putative transposase